MARKKSRRKHSKVIHREEPKPVLAGRLLIAALILAVMVIFPWPVDALTDKWVPEEPEKPNVGAWSAGKSVTMKITLITADFDRLGCVLDREIGGAHCEYKTESELWPVPPEQNVDNNKKNVIQPYSLAPNNQLVMVGGLWAQPALMKRVQEEPFQAISEKKLARFIAECQVRLVEQLQQVTIRWAKDQGWGKQGPAWVGVVESCKLIDG